uniref:Uncharacterized protein n=1 Tax=Mola mola TaxID=94237 RepID=A0A3Q3XH61_MOLML
MSFLFFFFFTSHLQNRVILCEREVIMDHRGHHRPEPGHNSCRSKDREEQRRYHQQLVREQIPPSLSSRDRDRHWVYPEASYRAVNVLYMSWGAVPPCESIDYEDPRDTPPQNQKIQLFLSLINSFRYDQGRDYSQHYLINQEDNPSRNNEEVSSYNLGTLASSKNSGLSSSSYELCQYINGAEQIEPYAIPHVVASFGPAGQLVRVTPGLSTRENVRQVEIHSLEVSHNINLKEWKHEI